MLTGNHWFASSDEWCAAMGCCGYGWEREEEGQALAELRAAHVMAGVPIPDWIRYPAVHPPRRRERSLPAHPDAWHRIVIEADGSLVEGSMTIG